MSDYQSPLSPMRFQSQLGKEMKRVYNEGKNIVKLSLARVVKVNYKYNTVDVVTILHKNSTTKNPNDKGKFSAKLPIGFGGRTPEGKVFGTNTLVTVGALVLIGFMEGDKDYPIVLNIYGDTDHQSQLTRTNFDSADESDESIQRELWQLFTLYPSMTYKNTDGNGNKEVTFSGKTFLYMTDTDPENAYVNDSGFEYEHLPNSRYADGQPIEPKSADSPTLLYVHQGVYQDHRVTFFVKSDGTVRMASRHTDGKGITFQEMGTDGTFTITQKRDTTDPERASDNYSEFRMDPIGTLSLKTKGTHLEIRENGVFVNNKPIGYGGGGDGDGGIDVDLSEISDKLKALGDSLAEAHTSITLIQGEIDLKADAKIVDALNNTVQENSAQLTVAFDEISTRVTQETFTSGMQDVRDYAKGLNDSVSAEVGDVSTAVDNLNTYVDTTFRDGVIDEAEAKAIEKYINTINTEKADVDAKYSEIYNNSYLAADKKTPLETAKSDYDNNHITLINAINTAISDNAVTGTEKADVDEAFADYKAALSSLSGAFEVAIDAISMAKAVEALGSAKDYTDGEIKVVNSSIDQLANEISLKVDSETYTTDISDIRSKQAQTETNVEDLQTQYDEVVKNIPYRAEILSSQGVVFKNGNVHTILSCKVYRGADDVTDTLNASQFHWTRVSDDPEGDTAWNSAHAGGTKTITVTPDDVVIRATFNCEIDEV